MIFIWVQRWLSRGFRLWYQWFGWVFLCSVISGLKMLTPGDPCLCVSVCVCVCLSVCVSVTASHFHKSWPMLMKIWPHNPNKNLRWHFSQILKILIQWRHNGFFICFSMRHSHVFNFCVIFFKLISYVLQLIALYGIANQRFRFISSIQNGRRKNGKTVKIEIYENRKLKRRYMLIWSRWWRIWPY